MSEARVATTSGRPRFGFVLVNLLLFWVTMAIASTALWPVYLSPQLPLLVLVTVAVGSAIAVLGAVYRWPSVVVLVASVLAFLLLGVPLAVPTETQFGVLPTIKGLLDLLTGAALGWKQLVTITLPVGQYEALLVPAFTLLLVASVVGLTIALRARHGEFAVLAPVLVFITAIAFGPDFATWSRELSLGLLAAILLWLIWFRWYRRRASIRRLAAQGAAASGVPLETARESGFVGARTLIGAGVIVALASGAAVVAVAALPPTSDRVVLRTAIEQPFDPRDYASPLSGFRQYWQSPTVDSTLLTVSGLPEGGRLRVATLDTYNGIVYSVGSAQVTSESGSFTRVPYRFDQSSVDGSPVDVTVLVGDYSGVWLPTVGQLESVAFRGDRASALQAAFYYNNTSGTAAVIGGLEQGDSYELTAIVPKQPSAAQLSLVDPGSASVPALGSTPDQLATALDGYIAGLDTPGKRLVAAIDGLKQDGYISHGVGADAAPSRSGHAEDRISQLFSDPRMIGDAEQYSVAAALMARELGFPARVVVGFVPDGTIVRGSDVSAWIEVNTAQYGWVTIDPTPETRPIPDELPEEPAQVARPQTIVPPPEQDTEKVNRQTTPESQEDRPNDLDPILGVVFAVLRVAGWVLAGLAIVLAPFVVVIAAKVRRRRLRRRAPTPAERISGGWQEFEDSVLDHGILPPPAATRNEVAATVGGSRPVVLAAVADRAIFSPDEPEAAEADVVWKAVDELRTSLDHGLTRWQRLKARISLRSLGANSRGGYSVTKFFKR
ncbi:MAG: transglutaminase-like domain-containing protein [Rhodoglobus sp.]